MMDEKGAYLSYELYAKIASQKKSLKTVETYLSLTEHKDNEIISHETEKSIQVRAVLKKGLTSSYMPSVNQFIYMYYQDYEDLYDQHCSSAQFAGYTLFIKDFDSLVEFNDKIKETELGVNSDFVNIRALDTIIESVTQMKYTILLMINIVFLVMILSMQMNYFYKRSREFALLKINGLTYLDLTKLNLLETGMKVGGAIVIAIPLYFVASLCLHLFGKDILSLNMIDMLSFVFINIIVMIVGSYITNIIYLKKLNPENILRK